MVVLHGGLVVPWRRFERKCRGCTGSCRGCTQHLSGRSRSCLEHLGEQWAEVAPKKYFGGAPSPLTREDFHVGQRTHKTMPTPLSATEKKEVVASGGTELFKFFKKLVKHDARNAVPSPDLTQNLNSLYPMLSQHCIDCDKSIDMEMERGWGMWGSVNNGCFFCMNCSGRHRSIGVHLRFALLACPVGSDCVCTQLRPLHSAR